MEYTAWQEGTAVASPVYFDANVLVGAAVTRHPFYKKAAQLIGELLASEAHILVSVLTVQESLWALAHLSYCELYHHPSTVLFKESTYKKHLEEIFRAHGPRMEAISRMLHDWSEAGVTVQVVPNTRPDFLLASDLTPRYMREFRLTPADAAHLALAETHAKSFVTADSEFRQVARQATAHTLTVVHLTP